MLDQDAPADLGNSSCPPYDPGVDVLLGHNVVLWLNVVLYGLLLALVTSLAIMRARGRRSMGRGRKMAHGMIVAFASLRVGWGAILLRASKSPEHSFADGDVRAVFLLDRLGSVVFFALTALLLTAVGDTLVSGWKTSVRMWRCFHVVVFSLAASGVAASVFLACQITPATVVHTSDTVTCYAAAASAALIAGIAVRYMRNGPPDVLNRFRRVRCAINLVALLSMACFVLAAIPGSWLLRWLATLFRFCASDHTDMAALLTMLQTHWLLELCPTCAVALMTRVLERRKLGSRYRSSSMSSMDPDVLGELLASHPSGRIHAARGQLTPGEGIRPRADLSLSGPPRGSGLGEPQRYESFRDSFAGSEPESPADSGRSRAPLPARTPASRPRLRSGSFSSSPTPFRPGTPAGAAGGVGDAHFALSPSASFVCGCATATAGPGAAAAAADGRGAEVEASAAASVAGQTEGGGGDGSHVVVEYPSVRGGELWLLETITECPYTWHVPHAWLRLQVEVRRQDIAQLGDQLREEAELASAARLERAAAGGAAPAVSFGRDLGHARPDPMSSPEATLLDRLKYDLSRDRRSSELAWISSKLKKVEAHTDQCISTCEAYTRSIRARAAGRPLRNSTTFKPSTLKADFALRYLATNLHAQRLSVFDADARPAGSAAAAEAAARGRAGSVAGPVGVASGAAAASATMPPVASYSTVTCGAPAAHALGFKTGGIWQLQRRVQRTQEEQAAAAAQAAAGGAGSAVEKAELKHGRSARRGWLMAAGHSFQHSENIYESHTHPPTHPHPHT